MRFRLPKTASHRRHDKLKRRVKNLEMAFDHLLESPKYISSPERGFNGQMIRKEIFLRLLDHFQFDAILETGTWIGDTTAFMAANSDLPVYTVESDKRFHLLARFRLQDIPNIYFHLGDSRAFLNELSSTEIAKQAVFIYLDAHWYNDLPLGDEIEIISSNFTDYIIMVDDFEVPGDSGYKFDDYGKNRALRTCNYSELFRKHDLMAFFPSAHSSEESGRKRGCVVLAKRGANSEIISSMDLLSPSGPTENNP